MARGLSEVIEARRAEHVVLVREPRRGLSVAPSLADRLMDANPNLEIHLVNPANASQLDGGRFSKGDIQVRRVRIALKRAGSSNPPNCRKVAIRA